MALAGYAAAHLAVPRTNFDLFYKPTVPFSRDQTLWVGLLAGELGAASLVAASDEVAELKAKKAMCKVTGASWLAASGMFLYQSLGGDQNMRQEMGIANAVAAGALGAALVAKGFQE